MANSQTTVQGSVTLRKMRSGATAAISISSNMNLYQLYDDDFSPVKFAPDWSGANSHPTVTVNVSTSSGRATSNVTAQWFINGVNASTIYGCYPSSNANGMPTLEINTNLAQMGILNLNSGTLTAQISYTDEAGNSDTVTKSEIIRVQKAVSNGYVVMISANKAYVDSTTSTTNKTTLSAVCYLGTQLASGITFYWLKSTTETVVQGTTPSGATYNITDPDEVNGSQLYICRAFDGSGNEVDAEGIVIVDNSDELIIVAEAQQYKNNSAVGIDLQKNITTVNTASDNERTSVTFKVMKTDGSAYGTVSSWTAEKKHADTMKLIQAVSGEPYTKDTNTVDTSYNTKTATNSASVSIDVLDADYLSVGDGTADRHDTEVVVTATANL